MPPEVWHTYQVCSVDEDEKTKEDERIRKEVVFSPGCSRQRAAFGEFLTALGRSTQTSETPPSHFNSHIILLHPLDVDSWRT